MKTGMNLLLWTTRSPRRTTHPRQIKVLGFDAVEVPVFDTADLAPFSGWASGSRAWGSARQP